MKLEKNIRIKINQTMLTLGLALLSLSNGYAQSISPLPPEQVFHFIGKVENNNVLIYASTQQDYKLYKDSIKVRNDKSSVKLEDIIKPSGKKEYDEFLHKYKEEYEGDFLLEIPISDNNMNKIKSKNQIEFDLEAQGCTKGLCYSPFLTHIKLKVK